MIPEWKNLMGLTQPIGQQSLLSTQIRRGTYKELLYCTVTTAIRRQIPRQLRYRVTKRDYAMPCTAALTLEDSISTFHFGLTTQSLLEGIGTLARAQKPGSPGLRALQKRNVVFRHRNLTQEDYYRQYSTSGKMSLTTDFKKNSNCTFFALLKYFFLVKRIKIATYFSSPVNTFSRSLRGV